MSPAYDLNPNEYGTGLSLNISEKDNTLDLDLAVDVAGYFRVDKKKANEIITQVKDAVSGWRNVAKEIGLSGRELEIMRRAFEF